MPDYPKKIDEYIFEMIEMLIPENDKDKKKKYDLLNTGLNALKNSLDDDYREELEAYAEKISGGVPPMSAHVIVRSAHSALVRMLCKPRSLLKVSGNRTAPAVLTRAEEYDILSKK